MRIISLAWYVSSHKELDLVENTRNKDHVCVSVYVCVQEDRLIIAPGNFHVRLCLRKYDPALLLVAASAPTLLIFIKSATLTAAPCRQVILNERLPAGGHMLLKKREV